MAFPFPGQDFPFWQNIIMALSAFGGNRIRGAGNPQETFPNIDPSRYYACGRAKRGP